MQKKLLLAFRDVLRRRGFWVELTDGELVLDPWYSDVNFFEMTTILKVLRINFGIGKRGIRILPNAHVSDEIFRQIERFDREKWYSYGISRWQEVPAFWPHDSRNDIRIKELDRGIASLVFALNKAGLYTTMSCDGHGKRPPKIWMRRREDAGTIRDILTEAAQQASFAYDWKIKTENPNIVLTARKRLFADEWDVGKIQDDAVTLSEYIYNNCCFAPEKRLKLS